MRYRLKTATWVVVREATAPPPRVLSNPAAVRDLARDLLRDADDDREHFWLVLLNSQHHYLLSTLVSVGTLNASLVHPRQVFGPAVRYGAAPLILVHNHPSGDPMTTIIAPTATRRRTVTSISVAPFADIVYRAPAASLLTEAAMARAPGPRFRCRPSAHRHGSSCDQRDPPSSRTAAAHRAVDSRGPEPAAACLRTAVCTITRRLCGSTKID